MADKVAKLFGSSIEFSTFGKQALAYVRPVQSDDMNERFPHEMDLPKGVDLWGLFAADGEPIALSDECAALYSDAEEMDLVAVRRH